jgi:hypothetical protein
VAGEGSGLQVPEELIEGGKRACIRYPPSLRLGDCPSFYRPRREQFTGVPHYSPTCEGMASSAMELMAVLANLAPVGASWRVLCLYRSGFEGAGAEVGCPAAARGPARGCRQREVIQGTAAGVVMSRPCALQQRRRCRHSARRDVAVAGMAAQS